MSSFNSQSTGMRQPGATMERPTTAASSNRKIIDLENELKNEKKSSKKLMDEVEALKKEILKQNFS